jgi:glycosyltransferase involved in cell wall biosynthesis
MNISYIFSGTFFQKRASSIQVAKMCQAIREEGHGVTLIVQDKSNYVDLDRIWPLYGIRKPFKVCVLKKSKFFPFASIAKASQLKSDLIFTRNLYVAFVVAIKGFPIILEIHDFIKLRRHVTVLGILKAINRQVQFIAITHALKNDLISYYPHLFNDDNTFVEPDGVDIESFQSTSITDQSESKMLRGFESNGLFIAGYAGNLYPGKGYEIISKLAPRMPDVLFLVAGGPDETAASEDMKLCDKGIGNIKLIGYLPGEKIPYFLSICDALLLPNQKNVQPSGGSGDIGKYTSPLKLFEYLASGKPVLASDLPVLREVLNEKNAVLVPYNDVIAWEKGLRRIMENKDALEAIRRKASMDASKYDWRQRVKRILNSSQIFCEPKGLEKDS